MKELESHKPRRILIHAPNGLKHLYICIEEFLNSLDVFDIHFSTSPGYGACDIPVDEAESIKADLLIHIGHEEYYISSTQDRFVKLLYIPVYYKNELKDNILDRLHDDLKHRGIRSISLSSTLLEKHLVKRVKDHLESKGLAVFEADRPILGCFYSHVISMENIVDAHVVVAGGLFHAIGLGLIASKPVIALDPYMGRLWNASEEAGKVLRKRFYIILRAKESPGNRMGLIMGTRLGQYREFINSYIEREALLRGFKVYRIASSYLTIDRLIAIDSALDLDFYVITSCPRLPIDDLSEFHKPVLTPGEFIVMITGSDKYIYPW